MLIRYVTSETNYKPRLVYLLGILSLIWFVSLLATPAVSANRDPYILVALGDSLTAGYGLRRAESFPAQLQISLRTNNYNVTVINAGVSGDTAAGGLSRLDWSLGSKVDGVIIELGANDALRGISPASTRTSLEQILIRLKQRNIDVLLTGMLAPLNMGPEYGTAFNAIFPDLARKYNLAYYPFFLEGVATIPSLNQADGLHPTARGVKIIVQKILPKVEDMLAHSIKPGLIKQ